MTSVDEFASFADRNKPDNIVYLVNLSELAFAGLKSKISLSCKKAASVSK